MKCINCNKEINDGVKFCKFCGSAQKAVSAPKTKSDESMCPKCGKAVSANVKFCKFCGEKLNGAPKSVKNESDGVETHANYITWHVLPGQLALKIDERDIESYKSIKGVYIAPGTKALFFVNGKLAAMLDSGTYPFKDWKGGATDAENENSSSCTPNNATAQTPIKENRVVRFFKNIANHVANGISVFFGSKPSETVHVRTGNNTFYTIVLIRGAEFPLVFDFDNILTKTLTVDIGLHIRCKVTNLNLFFEDQMTDKKIVSIKNFADAFNDHIYAIISRNVADMPCEDIQNNEELVKTVLESINASLKEVYDYITVTHIISLSSFQEDLNNIRLLKEELYVAEKELEHLQQRYDYMNRLQSVENTQSLYEARTRVDFESLMDQIDNQGLLNQDLKEKFIETLEAQAELRRATTDAEQLVAINKLKKTTLLSEEEIDLLQKEIRQRANIADVSNAHDLAMVTIRNNGEIAREKLLWEMEIGDKKLDWDLARQDKILEHDMARDNKILDNDLARENKVFDNQFARDNKVFDNQFERDNRVFESDLAHKRATAEFSDERRQADIDFEKQQMANQMDLLRQAQQLREEREQAQHARDMEVQKMQMNMAFESEKLRANTELEKDKIFATMSFEQIMAANPNITPEAAAALAKKFEADAMAAQNDKSVELMRQHDEDLKAILSQQMNMTRDIVNAQAMASAATLENKQQELNRVHMDTQRNEDRYVDVMRTTVSATAGARVNEVRKDAVNTAPVGVFCPGCGKQHPAGTMFCDECGTTL